MTLVVIIIIIIIIIMLQPLSECNDDVSVDEALDHVTVGVRYSRLYFKE